MKATAIPPADLRREIAGANPPIVIDVRRRPAFLEADAMLSGALRREPDEARAWAKSLPAASAVVVYCVHGHEVSQGAAAALQETGIAARYLEGGLAGSRRSARSQAAERLHALGHARAAENRPHRLSVARRPLRRPEC